MQSDVTIQDRDINVKSIRCRACIEAKSYIWRINFMYYCKFWANCKVKSSILHFKDFKAKPTSSLYKNDSFTIHLVSLNFATDDYNSKKIFDAIKFY